MPEIPESLLRRSAEAKAKALGIPVEQVLAEMRGEAPPPGEAAPEETAPEETADGGRRTAAEPTQEALAAEADQPEPAAEAEQAEPAAEAEQEAGGEQEEPAAEVEQASRPPRPSRSSRPRRLSRRAGYRGGQAEPVAETEAPTAGAAAAGRWGRWRWFFDTASSRRWRRCARWRIGRRGTGAGRRRSFRPGGSSGGYRPVAAPTGVPKECAPSGSSPWSRQRRSSRSRPSRPTRSTPGPT